MEKNLLNWDSFADAIDRLIVCVHALGTFENKKREESLKSNPDVALIAHWDRLSRDRCEERDLLKREINKILAEISGNYSVLSPGRTFAPSNRTVADIIEEAIPMTWKEELTTRLKDTFK